MTGNELLIGAQIATPVICGAIGYLIKRSLSEVDRRQDRSENRLDVVERDMVGKEDWLRELGIARKKNDELLCAVQRLEGQNQAGVQIGTAIAAALNRRERCEYSRDGTCPKEQE